MTKKIIVDAFDTVACPHCGGEFMLQDAIAHQLIERYESEYEMMLEGERRQLRETLVGMPTARRRGGSASRSHDCRSSWRKGAADRPGSGRNSRRAHSVLSRGRRAVTVPSGPRPCRTNSR